MIVMMFPTALEFFLATYGLLLLGGHIILLAMKIGGIIESDRGDKWRTAAIAVSGLGLIALSCILQGFR